MCDDALPKTQFAPWTYEERTPVGSTGQLLNEIRHLLSPDEIAIVEHQPNLQQAAQLARAILGRTTDAQAVFDSLGIIV